MKKISVVLLFFLAPYASIHATTTQCNESATRYIFSWPISKGCDNSPRGGTSKGVDVIIDTRPHAGWLAIQNPKLSKFERDRAAILAMSGGYKVDFNFLETAGFSADFKRDRPYNSWGTEYVYVVENQPGFISLQHLMVMYFTQDDGTVSAPLVMKHWRQDWTYQDRSLLEYDYSNSWRKRSLTSAQVKGTWSQAVFQVDDSPRYESVGSWEHNGSFSTWVSGTTRRPLPRREYSVRKDYQALEGFNRHTITRYGWIQEEENWKLVIDENGEVNQKGPYISKELGVARYQLAASVDFSPGDEYMSKTGQFWAQVRAVWLDLIEHNSELKLHKIVDGRPLFMPLFQYASDISDGSEYNEKASAEFIKETLSKYLKQLP